MTVTGSLYARVMDKLRFEPNIDESAITIAIKSEVIVVLGGKVKSYTEKRLAEEAVKKIEEVRGVANELEVELLTIHRRSDADIVKAALNALQWKILVPYEQIKVAVENGHLTLSGEVEYNFQKQCAEEAVEDLYGITFITNNIKIKPNISPFEVKEKIIQEFERNAHIDANNILVEVDGGKVILRGSVKNFNEDKEAKTAAWSVPGVNSVVDQLLIANK